MRTAIVLFTRDLRVRDQPALAAAAARAECVVPLFVLDDAVAGPPNRLGFLYQSLADLRASLAGLGAPLVVRRGEPVAEVEKLRRRTGAEALFLSEDVSAYAQRRERSLGGLRLEVTACPGITVVPPRALEPYRVFTPYHRRWVEEPVRASVRAPRLRPVDGVQEGAIPALPPNRSEDLPEGGESAGRRRLERWLREGLHRYDADRDVPAADATSRLSPYLHFGCISPAALVRRLGDRAEAAGFVRQLAWRDFFAQLLLTEPGSSREDLRPRGDRWNDDPEGLEAWKEGRAGAPIVDAGMRQLGREGWMHNRVRLVVASFLTKSLYVDWRLGAAHFSDLLADGDLASNVGNWQWVAGTGASTRPNTIFNPARQAKRFDPEGEYVRRYVPELGTPDYPPPLVDHEQSAARFKRARARG